MSAPTDADRERAKALLADVHSGWCSAHPGHTERFRGPCHCRLKGLAESITAALAEARAESEARADMRSRGHARALGRIQRIREAHDWQCDCSEDDPCRIRAAIDTTEEIP